MGKITYQILNSLSQIKEEDWESIFGKVPEGYPFFKTLEESRLAEFSFYYLVFCKENRTILIAPLFITDFNLDIAVEGVPGKFIQGIRRFYPRFLITRTLFCGSPFGEKGVLGIIADESDKELIMNEVTKALHIFAQEKNAPLIAFKDFTQNEASFIESLKGFFKVESFPSVVTELNFNSFEDYLGSLRPNTRKDLRKKLRNAYSQADIKVKVVERIDDMIDEIFRLYELTYHSAVTRFERLTKEYFLKIGENLNGRAKFFLYYCNGKLGAFNLCLLYDDLLIDKFIGFDYGISRRYSLYFVSWCYNIEWCLKNSIHCYQTGQTGYGPKLRLGSKLIPLYAYFKHKNPLINSLLRVLSDFLKPK